MHWLPVRAKFVRLKNCILTSINCIRYLDNKPLKCETATQGSQLSAIRRVFRSTNGKNYRH